MKSVYIVAMLGVLLTACVGAPAPTGENCQNGTCADVQAAGSVRLNKPITIAITPTIDKDASAAQGTATRVEWSRRQTLVPPIENIWLITPPAWSTPRATWPPVTPMTPAPPRTLAPQSPRTPAYASNLSVASVRELNIADRSLLVSQLLVPSLHMDGKTLVGSVSSSSGGVTVTAVDLATSEARALAKVNQITGGPRVSDRYVVWSEKYRLQIYDLQQNQKRDLGLSAASVGIAGNTIVYQALDNNMWRVHAYDIAGQRAIALSDKSGSQVGPLVSNNWVVFTVTSKDSAPADAYFYWSSLSAVNLDTHEQIEIGQVGSSNRQAMPAGLYAIDVPWVAWASGQLGDTTLHLYNLQTRETFTVSLPLCKPQNAGNSGFVSNLRLSNGVVLFKCGVLPWQFLGYDILQKVFISIPVQEPTTEGEDLGGWTFVGDRIVWVWNPYENGKRTSHVYTAQIVRQAPPYP